MYDRHKPCDHFGARFKSHHSWSVTVRDVIQYLRTVHTTSSRLSTSVARFRSGFTSTGRSRQRGQSCDLASPMLASRSPTRTIALFVALSSLLYLLHRLSAREHTSQNEGPLYLVNVDIAVKYAQCLHLEPVVCVCILSPLFCLPPHALLAGQSGGLTFSK